MLKRLLVTLASGVFCVFLPGFGKNLGSAPRTQAIPGTKYDKAFVLIYKRPTPVPIVASCSLRLDELFAGHSHISK